LSLRGGGPATEIKELVLLDIPAPGIEVLGNVDGVPAVAGQTFFGYEHPLAKMAVADGRLRGSYPFAGGLVCDTVLRHSVVIGVYPAGQLRRAFLYYIERERAHPYRPFLHHNNGEDMGTYFAMRRRDPEAAARFRAGQVEWWRAMIQDVGRELVEKRGVKMDSFVHDWGWDDENLVWQFHSGFPNGFAPLRPLVDRLGASFGIWLAPHGQYGVSAGEAKGWAVTIPEAVGLTGAGHPALSLADEKYYAHFLASCAGMIEKYGVNYFKFDGVVKVTGNVEALLRIMRELRKLKPDVFINPSSGTWPSPFWLRDADSTWRGGSDLGLVEKGPEGRTWLTLDGARLGHLGIGQRPSGPKAQKLEKGSPRQQWITYRDYEVYNSVLGRCPLYPISSLMIHGIAVNVGGRVKTFNQDDIVSEIRSFFATGVDHQELFITPKLMTERTWDVLAESAKWSRANAATLADTHWIGGDPANYEVYGWASWSKNKAILSLRNPNDQPAEFAVDVGQAFELPPGAPSSYELKSPWKEDSAKLALHAARGHALTIKLAPFEVIVLEAFPHS
ncbi:MAG: hypothetical protein JOZ62_18530, partial [Acidobacteriaceae bacterium]|nr:hypothetical protein [Acidobacteriaceae bacterium]